MTLSKQQIANRQNAQKSTGPKTEQGKETVSQNATKYGLFSKRLVINSKCHSEDRVDYELLIEDLRKELDPQSFFQEHLIKKIANCLWRAQRASIAETAHINKRLNELDVNIEDLDLPTEDGLELLNLIGVNSIPDQTFAARILYYEMRIDRQLSRTYEMLRKLQRKESQDQKENEKKNAIPNNKPILL